MQGVEPKLTADYVETGRVKLVFWPVLNHGNPSVFSTLAAECAGRQDPSLFWKIHDALFANQDGLASADRDFYVNLAERLGADRATFETCYDDGTGLEQVMELDALRRRRGVVGQPTFDINGDLYAGLPSYDTFQAALDAAIEAAP